MEIGRYNLTEAVRQNQSTILTFGGAFSNHIAATASACNRLGLKSIGIIRGDFTDNLNPTLVRAKNEGMQLQFVDRETYRINLMLIGSLYMEIATLFLKEEQMNLLLNLVRRWFLLKILI